VTLKFGFVSFKFIENITVQ